jgi:chemotaxis protein methyltransferase CheR
VDGSVLLARTVGIDLGSYREQHVTERIRRALDREGVPDVARLDRLLRADPEARARFRRSIAVSVSGPFRDPVQFELLERELLPELLADRRKLTVWSAGCADGSELYSLGIVLARLGRIADSLLVGSDLLDENIAAARAGSYDEMPVPDVVRSRVRWERRDVLRDGAAPGPWRLILCRNLAIYLEPNAKAVLHWTLAESLTRGGILLLGRSERIADPSAFGLERAGAHAYRKA